MIKNSRVEKDKTPVPGSNKACSRIVDGDPVNECCPKPNKSFDKIASILDNGNSDEKNYRKKCSEGPREDK